MTAPRSRNLDPTPFKDGTALCLSDPWLAPYREKLKARQERFLNRYRELEESGGLLDALSLGHRYFGLNRGTREGKPGLWYREWAPAAQRLALVGDFNGWNRESHPLERDPYGVWSCFLPDCADGTTPRHGQRIKVHVVTQNGATDRIPAYIQRAVQDPHTHEFSGQVWQPETPYAFQHRAPPLPQSLRIYEAHVGMAPEQGKVGSFREFTETVLPYVAELGYNTLQLMAVVEHPYYGSFGYHVSNFFAVSSRFGTPEELKALIDEAHRLGVRVLLDLVHSHAVKNQLEGLSNFDGSHHQYFHAPPRGVHSAWDSRVFDYDKFEVLRFLLSNVRFWLEEYQFDGFRFDGVTSMLYLDHGLGKAFSSYDDYFGPNVDEDAITYLKLANLLTHRLRPEAVTIAEDVSGMPGMARPVPEGGLGFDYRLSMGVPDYWIKLLKERRDEDWNLAELFGTLLNRRLEEKHVGYAESHDQALVGDKTLAFRLMDAAMYHHMSIDSHDPVIERGIALHKLIRLLTFSAAGEAWLNFMGNEFGHPEWVDFPREGNHWSYHYARRQWSLVQNQELRYAHLHAFDRALQELDAAHGVLCARPTELLLVHEERRLLVYRRGPLVFAVNLHPTEAYQGLRIPLPQRTDYQLALDSDAPAFGGHGRLEPGYHFPWQDVPEGQCRQSLQIYLPNRTGLVLAPA